MAASRTHRFIFTLVALLAAITLVGAVPAHAQDDGTDGTEAPTGDSGGDDGGDTSGDGGGDTEGDGGGDDGTADADDSEADEDEGSNTDWQVLLSIALVVVLLLAAASVLSSLMRRGSPATPAYQGPSPLQRQVSRLGAQAQWVHDSVSLHALATDPASLRPYWDDARREITNVEASISATISTMGDTPERAPVAALGQSLASLTSAMQTHVSLRSTTPSDNANANDLQFALRESSETVARRRAELQACIDRLDVSRL